MEGSGVDSLWYRKRTTWTHAISMLNCVRALALRSCGQRGLMWMEVGGQGERVR